MRYRRILVFRLIHTAAPADEKDVRIEKLDLLGIPVEQVSSIAAVYDSLSGDDLVLACLPTAGLADKEAYRKIRESGAALIVYVTGQFSGVDALLDWCADQVADDVIVQNEPAPPDVLLEHAKLLGRRTHPDPCHHPCYQSLHVGNLRSQTPRTFFIATPMQNGDTFAEGIVPGLCAAGYDIDSCHSSVDSRGFAADVREKIRNCQAMIANVPFGARPESLYNVYFEVGQAYCQDLPIIVVHQHGAEKVPSDLSWLAPISYDNPTDLALKLYFGLR